MSTVSLRARALAALAVLVLFPVFVVLLVAAIVLAAGWLTEKVSSSVGSHVFVLVIPLLLAVGAAVRDVARARRPRPVPGHELTRQDHPALWSELDQLARAMNQPQPDRVVVLPTVNAFVTTAAGHREVMIGYPLLAGLSRPQLRSVLAHEMGHLAHGHTRTGGLAYRAGGVLQQTVTRLDGGLVRHLVVAYYRFYLLISMSVLRDHERQADEWSARLAGGPEAASVFPELARLDAVWTLLGDRYLPLAAQVNARPALWEAINQLSDGHKAELDAFVTQQVARKPSRWSTHPADAERMSRLRAAPALTGPGGEHQPAWLLLGKQQPGPFDPDLAGAALVEVEAGLLSAQTSPASWEQVVNDAELDSARHQVGFVLDQLAVHWPERQPTLRNLLDVLSGGPDGSGGVLVGPLLRGDLAPDRRPAALVAAIGSTAHSAVLLTLADQGRARMVLRWDGPAQLEYRDPSGEVQPWPSDLAPASPFDAAQVARILDRLVRDGIDVDTPLLPDPGTATELTGRPRRPGRPAKTRTLKSITSGAVVAVQVRPRVPGVGRRILHDILVMDDGLLFSRLPKAYGFWATAQQQYMPGPIKRKGVARVEHLAQNVDGDPKLWAEDPAHGAFWVPYPSIRQASLRKGGMGKRLTLNGSDGSTTVVKWTTYSLEVAEVDSVLRAALHDRLK
jgi:Zn-dependent protease with chaperone function